MRFEIDPSVEEAQRACAALVHARLGPDRSSLFLYAVYAAIGGLAYVLTPATRGLTFLIALMASLATAIGLQLIGRARIRRLQTGDPHATERLQLELSAVGVHVWCAHIDARYEWSEFVKVTENGEFYLFVRAPGSGAWLPKRLLDSATDNELRGRVKEWAVDRGANLARELGAVA